MITAHDVLYLEINKSAILSNETIDLSNQNIIFEKFTSSWITFDNCKFICNEIGFVNIRMPELMVNFKDCIFNCEIKIINSVVDRFTFENTKSLKSLMITKGDRHDNKLEIKYFEFKNDEQLKFSNIYDLNTNFHFNNCHFENFSFENIRHIDGKFIFNNNILGNKDSLSSYLSFNNSKFYKSYFWGNKFKNNLIFSGCSFSYNSEESKYFQKESRFLYNEFKDVDFSNCSFLYRCIFKHCKFQSIANFTDCKHLLTTELLLIDCTFEGYLLLDNSQLNNLQIAHSTFEKKASFYNLTVNSINLHQITFNKHAYFDNLKILDIENNTYLKEKFPFDITSWKHTLRLIKQELQKTENRIDYNRFRVYEFTAYRLELVNEMKELKPKIKSIARFFAQNKLYVKIKRDLVILTISEYVSDYGTDWKRALKFTLLFGFIFYIPFFIFENWNHSWDLNNWQVFPIGFLRFFILTDFYSPLKDGKTYIEMDKWNHFFSWLIFILGKIVIAFGIYEMIQAFRKFKA